MSCEANVKREENAFDAGYEAFFQKKPKIANPYEYGEIGHDAWLIGWKDAQREYAE